MEVSNRINDLKVFFAYWSYLGNITRHYNYLRLRGKQFKKLVAEEMYYGLTFPHAKQCETIDNELKTYFIA